MIEGGPTWTATVRVRTGDPRLSEMLERSLRPEAEREVRRAHAELRRSSEDSLELAIDAHDLGALRAALNTYLGWVALSLATARSVGPVAPSSPPPRE
ncbi:MAG: KEOPS complex subunit Pcc1 [Thermoplasmata archaeon]